MPLDLDVAIRDLFDGVEPVSAAEARARALRPSAPVTDTEPVPLHRGHRRQRLVLSAAAALLIAGVIGAVVSQAGSPGRPPQKIPMVLTATQVAAITSSSTSAATSGTATVTQRVEQNGAPLSDDQTAVTFSGSDLDEVITVNPEPPSSGKVFSTDDRYVDGQFYIHTPGPNDVPEWMHDADSADDASSMQFPDPRTLYAALSPSAQFEVVGTSTANGITVTHLQASDPGAMPAGPLGNLAQGALTSFDLWVTPDNVVQQMAFSSSQDVQACSFHDGGGNAVHHMAPGSKTSGSTAPATDNVVEINPGKPGSPATCGPQRITTSVTVGFANLGQPESITAPQGAVDFSGKG